MASRKTAPKCKCCGRSMLETHRTFGQMLRESLVVFQDAYGMQEGRPDDAMGAHDAKRGHALGCIFRQAKWWGLITNVSSGVWRITGKGNNFLHALTSIKSCTVVYNAECIDTYGKDIFIHDPDMPKGNPFKMKDWRGATAVC